MSPVVVVLMGLLAAGEATQPATENAEALIREGNALRRAGNDIAALAKFRRAYDIAPNPRGAAQLGFCEQSLRLNVEAEGHLVEAAGSHEDPWITKNLGIIEASLAAVRAQLGQIEVVGDPAGAEVWVNATRSGALPLPKPLWVSPGSVHVELRAPGHVSAETTTPVLPGQLQRIKLRLGDAAKSQERETPPAAVAVPPSRSPGAASPSTPSPEPAQTTPGTQGQPSALLTPVVSTTAAAPTHGSLGRGSLRTAALVAGGVAVAALGAGLVFGLQVRSANHDLETETSWPTYQARQDDSKHAETRQWVALAVAGAALATGVTCYLLGEKSAKETSIALAPWADDRSGGGLLRVSY
jgi:hypothetical protein